MLARKIIGILLLVIFAVSFLTVLIANGVVFSLTAPHISPKDDRKPDYILVLGAGLNDDGSPGRMLRDRLNTAIDLYEKYKNEASVPTIIVSGDRSINEDKSYDEVTAMHNYLLEKGIPDESVLEDPCGFSTSESIANLHSLEKDAHIAIVTQEYHLYRALFIAYMNDYSISGYAAPPYDDGMQFYRELREIAARMKDFFLCVFAS